MCVMCVCVCEVCEVCVCGRGVCVCEVCVCVCEQGVCVCGVGVFGRGRCDLESKCLDTSDAIAARMWQSG